MSEKDTAQKPMTKYDKKVQKRKEEELKEKRRKKIYKIAAIVIAAACVIGIASIPISNYMAVNATYVTIGGEAVTQVEFDYYYNASVNDYVSQYGSFLSYMGLDMTKDLASQPYDETMSWKDFFEQNAVNTIIKTKALTGEAKANGFTHDAAKELEVHMENIKEAAAEASMTAKAYYKATYGKYATKSNVEKYLSDALFASAYYEQVADSKAAAEEDIIANYKENMDTYDSVDYKLIEVAAEFEEKEAPADAGTSTDGTTAADGTAVPDAAEAGPTEEEIAAAMAIAKTTAEDKQKVVAKEGELTEGQTKANINATYSGWLFEASRKAGDTTIIEDTASNKYYVLSFEKRYLDETPTSNIRVIMTTEDNGAAILEEWNANGATEEAFIALVEKYSEDDFTNMSEGLYEGLSKSSMNEELGTWIFEEGRKVGDTTSLVMSDGYTYVMYYSGNGDPLWKVSVANTLLTEKMQEYLEEIKAPYTVEDSKGNLAYLTAGTADETQTETSTGTEGSTQGAEETTPVSTESTTESSAAAK